MKFDCVIGNPPFQAVKRRTTGAKTGMCGTTLWDKFFEIAVNLCKEDGIISLIHPGRWRKPENKLLEVVRDMDLEYLEIHDLEDGIETFGVSTGFDWYVLKNREYSGKTKIVDVNDKTNEIDLREWGFIPNSDFNLIKDSMAGPKDQKCEVLFSHSAYETRKKWMSKIKTDKYKYPCVYGLTMGAGLKIHYSSVNNKGHFGVPKIIIPMSKYTDAYVDYEGNYGMCQFAFGIRIDSREEGEMIKTAIMSDEFKDVWRAIEWIYNGKEWRAFKYFKKGFWRGKGD